jgi:hypothetical protein
VNPLDDLIALLPSAPHGRKLPRHERHKSDLLAVIATSSSHASRGQSWPGWAGPPRSGRQWLVAAASAVTVVVIGVLAVLVPRPSARPAEPRSGLLTAARHWVEPTAGLSGITVVTTSGNITVAGDGSATAAITAIPRYQATAPSLTSHVARGRLTITATCKGTDNCQVSLVLHVPPRLLITAVSSQGDIQLSGLSAGVVASTDQGAINLSGIAGPITAETSQGTITGAGLAATRASLSSEQGDIKAVFRIPPLLVNASTQEGSVDITLPSTATYHVIAQTQLGTASVSVPQSASSPRVIRAASQLGSVTVVG